MEFLLLFPMLVWLFIALFVYWDVFRAANTAQKGAYSIADAISRQGQLSDDYVDGMQEVFEFLLNNPSSPSELLITSIDYNKTDEEYRLMFSWSPEGKWTDGVHDETTINEAPFKDRIPLMAAGDGVLVVETLVKYEPAFDIGFNILIMAYSGSLDDQEFYQFIVTRPRFDRRICLISSPCPTEL
ncbi:MAG: hypothetical protein HC844_10100 [Tabrizicola sp.]|nr:hypothetical protein [Tabrizicola sp.]